MNRMKFVLPSIIDDTQSAFVQGRSIFNNIIVAHESVFAMKKRTMGKKGFVAAKLDISKAYDRVRWDYLEEMLQTMNFPDKWVYLLMSCFKYVKYSIVLNGIECGKISPIRGLRQRDPFSPYLFLIIAQDLSKLIQDAVDRKQREGFSVVKNAPMVTHLFFADDSLLMFKADGKNVDKVASLLNSYSDASGHLINLSKSAVFFNTKTAELDRDFVEQKL